MWIKESTEALAHKYPVDAKVRVHYDPDDPKTSVLDVSEAMARQNNKCIWLFVGFPFSFTIVVAIVNR